MRPFDVSRFRKSITKSIENISIGFHDPTTWISTGNFALNYRISGRFDGAVPLGKVTVFAGQPASGKSLIVSGNVVKNAQDMGIYVILIDTENALDEPWLQAFGVDTSEEKMLKLNMSMVNDVGKLMSDFIKSYREEPEENRPKVLFVIDSLGMLLSPADVAQFEKGEMKGDMGIKAKQLKALVKNVLNQFADLDIGLVATNHTYSSQDPYSPDDIVSGGCLTAGHKLRLSDGSIKTIETVNIGDLVQTLEGTKPVMDLFDYDDKEVFELELENGEKIQATGNHKFMIKTATGYVWKAVSDLTDKDQIYSV